MRYEVRPGPGLTSVPSEWTWASLLEANGFRKTSSKVNGDGDAGLGAFLSSRGTTSVSQPLQSLKTEHSVSLGLSLLVFISLCLS